MVVIHQNNKIKILNSLMLNGKKVSSEKLLNKSFKYLQKNTKKSSPLIFKVAFKNTMTSISQTSVKRRKNNLSIPFFLRKQKRIPHLIKLICSTSRYSGSISSDLSREVLNLCHNKGNIKANIKSFNQKHFTNKNFSHFRWF